jgi:hypothetical protein
MTRFLATALFASTLGLSAQGIPVQDEDSFYKLFLVGGFSLAHSHAHDMTQTTWGGLGSFNAEFGLQFNHPQALKVSIRPHVGYAKMTSGDVNVGNDADGIPIKRDLYRLTAIYLGADLVFMPWERWPITLSTGPSFHTWQVDKVSMAPGDVFNQADQGMKFGWRFGAGYQISYRWRAELTYTMTEWRSLNQQVPNGTVIVPGFNPSRPAYFCIRAGYSF